MPAYTPILATLGYIAFTHYLIPDFPVLLLLGYGLLLRVG